MKPIHLIAAVTLSMSGLTFAAGGHDHGHEHKPLHGGVVSEVKDMDYELVAKPDSIQLYLRDHGKPADITKGSAKLTVLSGNQKQEINLIPDGERFLAKGRMAPLLESLPVQVITHPHPGLLGAACALRASES